MLVTKLWTSFQQIYQDRLFSGSSYMTLFNFGAIQCASRNTIHILPEVIELGTVGISSTYTFPDLPFIQILSESFRFFS